MQTPTREARAFPNGRCYCGCGTELADPTAFFVRGHDSLAYSKIIRQYGSLANLIAALGGPEALAAGRLS